MTQLYLIRHGEAEGNLYRRMQGSYNGALTDLGKKQAAALDARFRDIPLDAVYSSDLSRAMETAAVLCRRKNLPLHTDPRLEEVHMGPWENLPFGNAEENDPERTHFFETDPIHWILDGADTFPGVADRTVAALTDIARENDGKTVAICSHGFAIRSALCKLFYGFDRPEACGYSLNTAVTLLTWDGEKFSLEFQYDTSHLDDSLRRTWSGPRNLCYRPLGPDGVEEYIRYRRDAWQVVYGTMRYFDGSGFWLDAQRTVGPDPNAMVVGYLSGTPVGIIQLSPRRDEAKGVGYIPFLYLREPFRHRGFGIQFIGHAVSFYRELGRTRLQLSVAPTNEPALGFYLKYGFQKIRKHRSRFGHLLLMEKDISMPGLPENVTVLPARQASPEC